MDAQNRAQDFATYLQDVAVQTASQKSAMQDLLEPTVGQRLLDVGCGVGDDVRALAGRVAPTGAVVGVDQSTSMIEEARSRNAGPGIEYQVADAHSLPFSASIFDAARVERTLQHVARPRDVLAEMARVVRPGGILTASEPDWGTLVVDAEDHRATNELVLAIADNHIRNGWIGRQLCGHFVRLGLEDVQVHPVTWVLRSFSVASQFFGLGEAANPQWLEQMRNSDDQGCFFAAITGFTAKGRRSVGHG